MDFKMDDSYPLPRDPLLGMEHSDASPTYAVFIPTPMR